MSILWSRRGVALCALLSVAAFNAQGVEPPPPLDRAEVERLVEEALAANPEARYSKEELSIADAFEDLPLDMRRRLGGGEQTGE